LAAEEWRAQEMAHTSVWHIILQPPNADPVPIHPPPPKDFGRNRAKTRCTQRKLTCPILTPGAGRRESLRTWPRAMEGDGGEGRRVDGRQGGAGLPEPGGAEAEAGKQSWELGRTGRSNKKKTCGGSAPVRAEVDWLRNPPVFFFFLSRDGAQISWGIGAKPKGYACLGTWAPHVSSAHSPPPASPGRQGRQLRQRRWHASCCLQPRAAQRAISCVHPAACSAAGACKVVMNSERFAMNDDASMQKIRNQTRYK